MALFNKNNSKYLQLAQKAFLFLIINSYVQNAIAQSPADSLFYVQLTQAIEQGNTKAIMMNVHNKVDITLHGQSGIYSKNQSKFILEDFFKKNKPEKFNIISKNEIEKSSFFVGKMNTVNQQFRVCILTKKIKDKIFIYQIRIEE